ncbi:DUF1015 domain-containing protein [Candidatus Solincola sp.]|nr:DUF1015 domain-containing protein [Actinomycetota bacterium]MDI7251694.1 DUF1015 domain-containing protein [Actinomycetota bacterium]
MVEIRPFRGTLYNPLVVEDVSRVVAPPYDVIDDRRREQLLSRSPYNIVRLILQVEPGESRFWNRSAALFRAWKMGEVLVPDSEPGFYVHRQTFSSPLGGTLSRTGLIAALRCQPPGTSVLPHEKTFHNVRRERLHLLRSCRANFSQVFTIFRDPGEEVLSLLEEATASSPLLEFLDDEGVEHRLWRLDSSEGVKALVRAVSGRRLIIADGHHRYETALAYSQETGADADPHEAAGYVSVTMVRTEDPGLLVLPVHRVLESPFFGLREVEERLSPFFDAFPLPGDAGRREGSLAETIRGAGRPAFLLATREGLMRFILRPGVEPHRVIPGGESRQWKELDISVLHALALGQCLGLDTDKLAEEGKLRYTPWESRALDAVVKGEAAAAFLVRPTCMEDIWRIAEGGERMPHKSSYFHPKLPSGLVIFDHQTAFR